MKAFQRAVAIAALAALGLAAPTPQGIDFDAVDSLPPPPTYTVDIGPASQMITFDAASALASLVAEVESVAIPTGISLPLTSLRKRTIQCEGSTMEPVGAGPVPIPNTAAAFEADTTYDMTASAAPIPPGYSMVFGPTDASTQTYGYIGYTTLETYDTISCAQQCNDIENCVSINIYYERDPAYDPGTGMDCADPPATINIKCAFWSVDISQSTATNTGQYRDQFQVLIAGSNGYVNPSNQGTPDGFTTPQYIGDAAINAPDDTCTGANTYLGERNLQTTNFDIQLCADACTAETNYDEDHPPADGSAPLKCTFFNTYLLSENGVAITQYCALYTESWPASYATNTGQYRGSDLYSISSSYIASTADSPNGAACASGTTSGGTTSGNP